MSIPYFRELLDEKTGFTYSLDNVVMEFTFAWTTDDSAPDEVMSYCSSLRFVSDSFQSFKSFTYHTQFIFHMPDESTYWVGIGFNGIGGVDYSKCVMDFNPNKVGQYQVFADVLNFIQSRSKLKTVKRYDLAVDIPVSRENFIGFKDQRIHDEYRKRLSSKSDCTEYWGKRSSPKFVKLYNKQIECKLDKPMTRLEMTLSLENEFIDAMPNIMYISDNQMKIGESAPTGTDLVLAMACCEHPEWLTCLPQVKRAKTKQVLKYFAVNLQLNPHLCNRIFHQARSYLSRIESTNKKISLLDNRRDYTKLLHRELDLHIEDI